MLSKFSLSVTAAFALSAAGAARGARVSTSTDEALVITGRPSTNDQINAAESGSPDSVDNKDQQRPPAKKTGEPSGKLRNQTNKIAGS